MVYEVFACYSLYTHICIHIRTYTFIMNAIYKPLRLFKRNTKNLSAHHLHIIQKHEHDKNETKEYNK